MTLLCPKCQANLSKSLSSRSFGQRWREEPFDCLSCGAKLNLDYPEWPFFWWILIPSPFDAIFFLLCSKCFTPTVLLHGARQELVDGMGGPFKKRDKAFFGVDGNGEHIQKGDKVFFKKAPPELLEGLPDDDQKAIISQEGKTLVIDGFDTSGKAEIEFIAHQFSVYTSTQTIWIDPKELFKVTR